METMKNGWSFSATEDGRRRLVPAFSSSPKRNNK